MLLAATERIRIASGIANVWGRDAVAAANAARVLADAWDGWFLLGLGSQPPAAGRSEGHRYERPVAHVRLPGRDGRRPVRQPGRGAVARPPVPRVLAALRPPMLRLAAAKALGALTYLVPVEHTQRAREIMGPDALLIAEQKVVLEARPDEGCARARAALAWYLDTPNYLDNLRWSVSGRRLRDGGSDALVDAVVVAGDEEAIGARVRAHLDAGATQVAIQPLEDDDPFGPRLLRRLAPVLLAPG